MKKDVDNKMKGFNRRTFLKGTAAAGVWTLAWPFSAMATSKSGGRLVIGTTGGGAGDSLDPTKLTSVGHGIMGYTLGNCLTEIAKGGELVPVNAITLLNSN